MKIKTVKHLSIPSQSVVRYKKTGNISEIMNMESWPKGTTIKKLNKDQYLNLKTGEVHEFKHIADRSEDLKSVVRSLTRGRDLINSNVDDPSYCRWLTLTYKENMTDTKRLNRDFKKFLIAAKKKYGYFKYITAAEPQKRGAWHLHVLLIFNHPAPFMKNEDVAAIWRQGFVNIKKIDGIENLGAYLTAYLGDLPVEDSDGVLAGEKKIKVVEVDGIKKSIIKGGRLHMYPPGFHIFRSSKGLKKPEVERIEYKDAKEKVAGASLILQETKTITDEKTGYSNRFSREIYNTARLKNK